MAPTWLTFCEIIGGASGGGGLGPVTVTWLDLRAWGEITSAFMEPWEARLIIRLSTLRAIVASEKTSGGGA